MVQAHTILVEAVAFIGDWSEPEQIVALCHHAPAPQHRVAGVGFGVVRGRRLGRNVESQKGGVELATPLDVGDRQAYVMDVAQSNVPSHGFLLDAGRRSEAAVPRGSLSARIGIVACAKVLVKNHYASEAMAERKK